MQMKSLPMMLLTAIRRKAETVCFTISFDSAQLNFGDTRMNPQTVNTLTWLAVLLLVCGSMVPSPLGSLAIAGLGGVVALVPIAFGSMKFRIAGLAVLLAALWLTADGYPDAKKELERYSAHARSK